MKLIDGKIIAQEILEDLQNKVAALSYAPLFIDVVVGDDPLSLKFVQIKGRTAEKIGINFKMVQLEQSLSTEAIIDKINELQEEPNLSGLIVQLPLPEHLDKQKILDAINPKFDVDCIGTNNTEAFYSGNAKIFPPTAAAIVSLLDSLGLDLSDKHVLVIGQGDLVGKPVAHMLKSRGLKVTTANSQTQNLASITPFADIIISGTGKMGLLYGSMIKEGAVVIDAGTAESSGGIKGDVDFDSVSKVASAVSPVPGGVGPVTVAKLLENVYEVAKLGKVALED